MTQTKKSYLTKKQYADKYNISVMTVDRKLKLNELLVVDLAPKNSKKRLIRIIEEA